MRFRNLLIASGCLLLVGCGGGGGAADCATDYWDGLIGTCLPEGWDVLDQETLRSRGVPPETLVAFQRKEPVSGQFPTVAVTEEPLSSAVDATEYSDANIRSVAVLEGYEQVDIKSFTVDEKKVQLHVFTAQPIEGEPMRRFYQVSTTVEDTGYTFTGVAPVSIEKEIESEMMVILENMTFEAPKEEE